MQNRPKCYEKNRKKITKSNTLFGKNVLYNGIMSKPDARLMCLHYYSSEKLAFNALLSGILTRILLGKLSCGGLRCIG